MRVPEIHERRGFLKTVGAVLALGSLPNCVFSTCRPNTVQKGNVPTSEQDLFWRSYKSAFLRTLPDDKGSILVDESGSCTPSEGMGHAMFFAAERSDQETFNSLTQGLSNFRKTNGLFRWRINPDGSYPPEDENLNCATETEQNVANAFLLAYEKTRQSNYLDMGLELLNNLWQNATILFQDRRILLPSDLTANPYWPLVFNEQGVPCQPSENGLNCRSVAKVVWSPSYFSPAHGRRFAKYDTAHDWNKLVNDWYELANKVFDAATKDPKRFGVTGINPMPDFVSFVPIGTNEVGVEDLHPTLTFPDEWEYDIIRIPIYVSMDRANPAAHDFLERFFSFMGLRGPQDVRIGRNQGWLSPLFNRGTVIAIGAYGAGLQAIGRDVTAYWQRVQINEDGFFIRGHYYEETICYYAYLLLNGMFPS